MVIILLIAAAISFASGQKESTIVIVAVLILNAIMDNSPETNEDVLKLVVNGETVEQAIINKTATIGEKLSFRRFKKLTKTDNQNFGTYLHGSKIAVVTLVENASSEIAKHVSMQAASMRPAYIRISDVPEDVVAKEKAVLTEETINEGKPREMAEKIVQGRIQKFFKEICLEEQPFIMDDKVNVKTYVKNNGGVIVDQIRFEVGEGMEKREENFAEEVAKQING